MTRSLSNVPAPSTSSTTSARSTVLAIAGSSTEATTRISSGAPSSTSKKPMYAVPGLNVGDALMVPSWRTRFVP